MAVTLPNVKCTVSLKVSLSNRLVEVKKKSLGKYILAASTLRFNTEHRRRATPDFPVQGGNWSLNK